MSVVVSRTVMIKFVWPVLRSCAAASWHLINGDTLQQFATGITTAVVPDKNGAVAAKVVSPVLLLLAVVIAQNILVLAGAVPLLYCLRGTLQQTQVKRRSDARKIQRVLGQAELTEKLVARSAILTLSACAITALLLRSRAADIRALLQQGRD